jgi:type I restriction enzyme R subunit
MLLDGQAKAMVVTSSRASVIRYKYAIEAYIKAHPEYDKEKIEKRLQFTVPGDPLVAFSGKVTGKMAIMPEDEHIVEEVDYLKDKPFAQIRRDYDYTEDNMNNLGYQSIESAFDKPESRILIVANKFQTGFNQKKLCAMYIDKHINNDIEIVQTYSRLNRTFPGKDKVFIIDFVNDPNIVVNAFKKYDTGAEMESAQRLEIIYEIKEYLDQAEVYTQDEFEAYKVAKYKSMTDVNETRKDSYRTKIYNLVSVPADRWNSALKAQQTAYSMWRGVMDKAKETGDKETTQQAEVQLKNVQDEIDKLMTFRKKLKRYSSAYEYITQIVDLGEPDLEVFSSFAKLLSHKLDGISVDEIDISSLVLSDFKLKSLSDRVILPDDNTVLKPMTTGGKGKGGRKDSLKVIVAKINEIWGNDVSTDVGARTINAIADYVASDDVSRIQIQNTTNSKEAIIADGRMERIIQLAAIALKNNEFGALADKIIADPQTWRPLADIIYDLVDKNKRIDMPEFMQFIKSDKK